MKLCLLSHRGGLGAFHGRDVDGLGVSGCEGHANSFATLHKYARARSDAGVLEVGVGFLSFCSVEFLSLLHVIIDLGLTHFGVHALRSCNVGLALSCHLFLNLNNGQK